MELEILVANARLLYGDDWQRPLARGLGPLHPDGPRDSIDDRLVRRWASEERPVPAWVQGALVALLEAAAQAHDRRAEVCRKAAADLREGVQPEMDLRP